MNLRNWFRRARQAIQVGRKDRLVLVGVLYDVSPADPDDIELNVMQVYHPHHYNDGDVLESLPYGATKLRPFEVYDVRGVLQIRKA